MHIHKHTNTHTKTYILTYMPVEIYICICVYVHMSVFVYMLLLIWIYICVYVYVHMCICVHVCMYDASMCVFFDVCTLSVCMCMWVLWICEYESILVWPSKTRRKPGTCILRPEAATVHCDWRSQDSMSHRGPIFTAGGHHSCLWAEPTRSSESHFPPNTGVMVTLIYISSYHDTGMSAFSFT